MLYDFEPERKVDRLADLTKLGVYQTSELSETTDAEDETENDVVLT
jgi:hypothetical protein